MEVGFENHGSRVAYARDPGSNAIRSGMRGDVYVAEAKPLPEEVYLPPLPARGPYNEYPKLLLHPAFVKAQQIVKEMPIETDKDQKVIDAAKRTMERACLEVHSIEEEEEALMDGYRPSVADHLVAMREKGISAEDADPRIPKGAEARRAAEHKKQTMAQEIDALRRRFAQLTGRKLDEDVAPVAAAPVVAKPKPARAKGGRFVKKTAPDPAPVTV